MTRIITTSTLLFLLLAPLIGAQRPEPRKTEIDGHTMYTMVEPGVIPAIFNPEFIGIAEADSFFHENEPLLVVRSGDDIKGYSTWQLDGHEVVNDYIGGQAITVTW